MIIKLLFKKYSVILLLILFIYVRLRVRSINPLWIDEITEINSLKSLNFLIIKYLPGIPGGAPGHYLLEYFVYNLFPYNKYILGLPGLLSQILVFFLIPHVITSMQFIKENRLFISIFITRFLFAIDPTLTFQSMEVRPYSLLPLLWVISFFVVITLHQNDYVSFELKKLLRNTIIWCPLILFIFIWHFYGVIMILTIYLFILFRKKVTIYSLSKTKYSFPIIFSSFMISIPVWRYFSKGSFTFNFSTLSTIPLAFMQIYSVNKGFPQGLIWQNWLYFICLLFMLSITVWNLLLVIKGSSKNYESISFVRMNIFLVGIPLLTILMMDYINRYGFWYRQFAWVMIPFYISLGLIISEYLIKFSHFQISSSLASNINHIIHIRR